jgi:hypothetical protein
MDDKESKNEDAIVDDGHAKVDDPVVAPARYAPKRDLTATSTANDDSTTDAPTKSTDPNSILTRLYDPDRMQKPAIWKFIKLVAPGPVSKNTNKE